MKPILYYVRRGIFIAVAAVGISSPAFATGSGVNGAPPAAPVVSVGVGTNVGVATKTIVPVTVVDESVTVLQTQNTFKAGDQTAALSVKTGDTSLKTGDTTVKTGDTTVKTGDTSLKTGDTSLKGGNIDFDFNYAPVSNYTTDKRPQFVSANQVAAGSTVLYTPTQTTAVNGIPADLFFVEAFAPEYTKNNTVHYNLTGDSGETSIIFNSHQSYLQYASKDQDVLSAKPVFLTGRHKIIPIGTLNSNAVAKKRTTDLATVIRDDGMFILNKLKGFARIEYVLISESVSAPTGVGNDGDGLGLGIGITKFIGNALGVVDPSVAKQSSKAVSLSEVGLTSYAFVRVENNDPRGVFVDFGGLSKKYADFRGKSEQPAQNAPDQNAPKTK